MAPEIEHHYLAAIIADLEFLAINVFAFNSGTTFPICRWRSSKRLAWGAFAKRRVELRQVFVLLQDAFKKFFSFFRLRTHLHFGQAYGGISLNLLAGSFCL